MFENCYPKEDILSLFGDLFALGLISNPLWGFVVKIAHWNIAQFWSDKKCLPYFPFSRVVSAIFFSWCASKWKVAVCNLQPKPWSTGDLISTYETNRYIWFSFKRFFSKAISVTIQQFELHHIMSQFMHYLHSNRYFTAILKCIK